MKKVIVFFLTMVMMFGLTIPVMAEETHTAVIGGLDNNIWVTKYGNVYTDCPGTRFFDEMGYEYGDVVTVSFLGKELYLPVVPTYAFVEIGEPAIIVGRDEKGAPDGYLSLAVNMGNFAETYGMAVKKTDEQGNWYFEAVEDVTYPIEIQFSMKEKAGYGTQLLLADLYKTDNREDYKELSDEEFANFREVSVGNLKKGVLYRAASPVNPEINRNSYADAAIKNAGVTVIMNLADTKDSASAYEGFADTYYAGQKVIYLNLNADFQGEEFRAGLAEGLRFFAENKGTYLVHCKEGKDRAGFVTAILECLMGASYEEVIQDYMVSFENYFGVEHGSEQYNVIVNNNIVQILETAFGVEELAQADLMKEAEDYVKELGLSEREILSLKRNLVADDRNMAALIVLSALLAAVAVVIYRRKRR